MKTRTLLLGLLMMMASVNVIAQNEFEVEVSGKGQPVLLFPGFTSTGQVYSDIKMLLAEQYEVHSFTLAGFGGIAPIEFPWLPQIKKGIERYIIQHQLENSIIIGHSLGGTLGLWLAADQPGMFSKIIVIDALPAMGALMFPDYDSENIVYDTPYNTQLLAMDESAFKKMAEQMAVSMSTNEEKHAQLVDWIVQTDRKTYVYGYTDLLKLDLRKELVKITIPVTILAATQPYGKEAAEYNYREQYRNLADYALHFADGAGHFIMFDAPEWFEDQIKSELRIP